MLDFQTIHKSFGETAGWKIERLSKGMRQKVQIAV